ncbi:MAG TPA: hypothetical protein VKT28_22735 [Puia sp.]|nr:hypothetical protein [Puia sp.]
MFRHLLFSVLIIASLFSKGYSQVKPKRIVNIVNFIRLLEPRDKEITEDVLYETVVSQINLFSRYHLPATYLLQYDALINPRYQQLLKTKLSDNDEVGAWWEITQPHVEAVGLKWRGRYPWDWHANVGFSTGYTPKERELLVDEYMKKFKEVFGRYPSTVASWFIDEHSLAYMSDKYHIVASANCKDQIGTDGYTLWGGYWNQAYYPSRMNAYMPAQTKIGQIDVPVFRMLGSDPIYQYESGLGSNGQGVITLEPVYGAAGSNLEWVNWFLKSLTNEPCLAFAYTQAGQENSFTWKEMQKGLEMQAPIFDSLRNAGKINVETMSASGKWFKENFPVTPATAVTATEDYKNEGKKTVWYNSRFFRANILWKNDSIKIRDIHLFDERLPSKYFSKPGTSDRCVYETLPFVDGHEWSTPTERAGLKLVQILSNGEQKEIISKDFSIQEIAGNQLLITWQLPGGEKFSTHFFEDRFEVECMNSDKNFNWALELNTAHDVVLPFTSVNSNQIEAKKDGFKYKINCEQCSFIKPKNNSNYRIRILPVEQKIVISCNTRS